MSGRVKIILLLSLVIGFTHTRAQNDSLLYEGSFQKGKWFTGLNGSFTSGLIESNGLTLDNNEFSINIRNGKFLRDKLLFGLDFQVSKSGSDNDVATNTTDQFLIGPFVRYYLSNDPKAGVYPQLSVQYARVIIEREVPGTQVSTESIGNGISFDVGVGFTYAITQVVGFDLSLLYEFTAVEAETEDRSDQTVSRDTIEFRNVVFSFGFVVMLDEFFF